MTKGREVYEEFRKKWNGKPALARVRVATGGAADILSLISPDEGDLMKDPAIMAMHNAGSYWDRPIHISM